MTGKLFNQSIFLVIIIIVCFSKTIDASTTNSNETEASAAVENVNKDMIDRDLAAALISETADITTDITQSEVEKANVESVQTEAESQSEISSVTEENNVHENSNQETVSEVKLQQLDPPKLSPYDKFYEKWRHFNIDLASKVSWFSTFSKGSYYSFVQPS